MQRTSTPLGILLAAIVLAGTPGLVSAQTPVEAPKNRYTPAQDVQAGQQAAAEVRKEFPLVRDEHVDSFIQGIGNRLVAAIPPQFEHPEFRYTFSVVNASDINAFALPGGPMFVNRGMIMAARSEGEVAGVMAHEIAHVALRHGTAQATKATPYEIGTIAGQILGAIVGGTAGQVIAQGSQFGIGTAFMRYSREYEKQADILGSHIMARAGYDPRAMAAIFQTIEKQGGPGGPEWLSDHPNPGNRVEYITQEAELLHVTTPARTTGALPGVQADLNRLPPAETMAQLEKKAQAENSQGTQAGTAQADPDRGSTAGTIGGELPTAPTGDFVPYDGGNLFSVRVPADWQDAQGGNAVRFAPKGAFGEVNGQQAFILGVEMGVAQGAGSDLRQSTEAFIQSMKQNNPRLEQQGTLARATIDGRPAYSVRLDNISEVGRPEVVVLKTTLLDQGRLFYTIDVAPRDLYQSYQPTFTKVSDSITIKQ